MKLKTIRLKNFKRFDDLTINLGDNPRKIIALVGPNGCGKQGKEFKETEFNSLVTDIINNEVKDKGGDIIKKSCDCDISTDVKIDLASLLTKDDEIYRSLRKEIFGIE